MGIVDLSSHSQNNNHDINHVIMLVNYAVQILAKYVCVGETGASPPTGHVRHLAFTSLQLFVG